MLLVPIAQDFRVRLACVRHAASVRSEPGSNSPFENLTPDRFNPLGSLILRASFVRAFLSVGLTNRPGRKKQITKAFTLSRPRDGIGTCFSVSRLGNRDWLDTVQLSKS